MTCDRARRLLALRAGGDLTEREAWRVADHVADCPECHGFSESLEASAKWLRSAGPPPVSESEYTELRRSVWSRIGEDVARRHGGLLDWRRLGLAGGALIAVLAALLLIRRAPRERTAAVATPAPIAVSSAAASRVAGSEPDERGKPPDRADRDSTGPERIAAGPPSRVRRPRAIPVEPVGVDRIEFRTANPNVRIIWLVRKGGEKSSSTAAGRNQEVS